MEHILDRWGAPAYGVRLGIYRVLLVRDYEAENPRDWENFGTLWFRPTLQNRWGHLGDGDLGDVSSAWIYFLEDSQAMQTFGSVRLAHIAFARWLRMVKGATNIKSVSVIEHSSATITYHDANYIERPVDWGHGTFDALMFDTAEGREQFDWTDKQIRECLTAELDATRAYVEGEVYIVITEMHNDSCDDGDDCDDPECDAWSEVESLGGFYGEKYAESDGYQALATLALTGK